MGIEIELKARVGNPQEIWSRIEKIGVFIGSIEKTDTYWFLDRVANPYGLRIREIKQVGHSGKLLCSTIATYKNKEISDGIEINNEKEFEFFGIEEFEGFLALSGYKKGIKKHKKGYSFIRDDILIELMDVPNLGWFVEIEIIAKDSKEETVETARKRLLNCLAKLEIPEDAIEPMPYTKMLSENDPGSQ